MSEKYNKYSFKYYHNNKWWAFDIIATSEEDAVARVKKFPLARCMGRVMGYIPFDEKRYGIFEPLITYFVDKSVQLLNYVRSKKLALYSQNECVTCQRACLHKTYGLTKT